MRARRRTRDWPAGVVLLLALAAAPAPAVAGDESVDWIRLPEVALDDLEPAVAAQLGRMTDYVQTRIADSGVSAAEVGDAVGELGRLYHAYDLRSPARRCYEIAERLAADDFRWPYLLAYLHQTEGRLAAAEEAYRRAAAHFADASPLWIRLGHVYEGLDRPVDAERSFRRALALDPDSAAAEAGLGQLLLGVERAAEAIAHLERALELSPEANRLYYPLARAVLQAGEPERARELMARSGPVGVRPADPLIDGLVDLTTGERVSLLRGQQAYRAGRWAEAVAEFRRAAEADPGSVTARVNLGTALAAAGDTPAAIEELERALQLAPGNALAWYNLGRLRRTAGDDEGALAALLEAAANAPGDGEIHYQLAETLRARGRLDEALLHYGRAIELAPPGEAARLGRAETYVAAGAYGEARRTLEEGLEAIPNSGLLAYGLSRLLAVGPDLDTRDGERALDLAGRVWKARPSLEHAELVAAALAEAGRCADAAAWQEKLVEQSASEGDAVTSARLAAALERYRGEPCRPPLPSAKP